MRTWKQLLLSIMCVWWWMMHGTLLFVTWGGERVREMFVCLKFEEIDEGMVGASSDALSFKTWIIKPRKTTLLIIIAILWTEYSSNTYTFYVKHVGLPSDLSVVVLLRGWIVSLLLSCLIFYFFFANWLHLHTQLNQRTNILLANWPTLTDNE